MAESGLISNVLQLNSVSLDRSQWKLDTDEIDADGDREFSADFLADNLLSAITVREIQITDRNVSLPERVERTVESIRKRAKVFNSRPCPEKYRAPEGWLCYSYEISVSGRAPDAYTIVHVTMLADRMVTKRVRIAMPSTDQKESTLLAAFNSIELKR